VSRRALLLTAVAAGVLLAGGLVVLGEVQGGGPDVVLAVFLGCGLALGIVGRQLLRTRRTDRRRGQP
jgi:ABC-type Mn2+/Zn2+ transport system permease subunit